MKDTFRRFAVKASSAAGSPTAFVLAASTIVVWAFLGPTFNWSEAHSLSINTLTTCVTFLMIFLVQNAQNREARATQIKLDELLRATESARNHVIGLEDARDDDMQAIQQDIRDVCED